MLGGSQANVALPLCLKSRPTLGWRSRHRGSPEGRAGNRRGAAAGPNRSGLCARPWPTHSEVPAARGMAPAPRIRPPLEQRIRGASALVVNAPGQSDRTAQHKTHRRPSGRGRIRAKNVSRPRQRPPRAQAAEPEYAAARKRFETSSANKSCSQATTSSSRFFSPQARAGAAVNSIHASTPLRSPTKLSPAPTRHGRHSNPEKGNSP